jgi:hypothetical protein
VIDSRHQRPIKPGADPGDSLFDRSDRLKRPLTSRQIQVELVYTTSVDFDTPPSPRHGSDCGGAAPAIHAFLRKASGAPMSQ